MSHTPDPRANGISTHEYCKLLPRQRYSHEAQGRILLLPSSGLVVVPFEERKDGGWTVVVVEGFGSYPVGGHHLVIGDAEAETAIELSLGEPVPVQLATAEEAEALGDGSHILTRSQGGLRKKTFDGDIRWVRSFPKRASLTTEEIADQFPVVVTHAKETVSV
jgi:hypothetical protein